MINQIQGIVIMTTMACAMCCAVESAEPKVDLPAPYGVTPSERQVKHAELEYYGFCHFTVDTFTDREWGLGTESESVFNPVQFDADQIVGAMKSAGMKGVILTCKHHDGFCLWPSEMTEHDIASSPYKTGKGDIVKEFADACSKAGIKFGVYLSPWDRNHPFYGKPEYIQVYRNQLRELLTGYGDIFEIWMDGANGGTGYYRGKVGPVEYKGELENRSIDRTTYYDWPNTWALMRELQPKAVLFSDVGPDIRWVGNERGDAGDPCRATINYDPGDSPGNLDISRLGTGDLGGKTWCQAEVDVSIRPGWFWHASQDMKVKSPEDLMEIYLKSVGRGATLLLNCPPDKRGLLHENDVASLKIFGEHLRKTFSINLATGSKITASNVRGKDPYYGPDRLLDDDMWSAWITDDHITTPEVVFELDGSKTFNIIRLREDIRLGLRVEGVGVDVMSNGQWRELVNSESIGSSRLWRVAKTTTDKVRIRVTKSPVCPALSDFGLYLEPEFDMCVPPVGGNEKAAQKALWKVSAVSFAAKEGQARNAIDGNPGTLWHTHDDDGERKLPQHIIVDMGKELEIKGFTYLPRQDNVMHGMVDAYSFEVSTDGKQWKNVSEGEFGNLKANPVEQTMIFKPEKARFFKFTAKHCIEKNHAAVAELGIIEL